jgi:hypothetical protein
MGLPFACVSCFPNEWRQIAPPRPGARGTAHYASLPGTLDTGCLIHYARQGGNRAEAGGNRQ